MSFVLKPHTISYANDFHINSSIEKKDEVTFFWKTIVTHRDYKPHSNPDFSSQSCKNWGLWEFDVVEIFIQPRTDANQMFAPYLELQISPLNQTFNLIIEKPRQIYWTPLTEFINSWSYFFNQQWITEVEFRWPLPLQNNSQWWGGMFACLGGPHNRSYYSYRPNPEPRPDFHRPELFFTFFN